MLDHANGPSRQTGLCPTVAKKPNSLRNSTSRTRTLQDVTEAKTFLEELYLINLSVGLVSKAWELGQVIFFLKDTSLVVRIVFGPAKGSPRPHKICFSKTNP